MTPTDITTTRIAQIIRDNLSGPMFYEPDIQEDHNADILRTAELIANLCRATVALDAEPVAWLSRYKDDQGESIRLMGEGGFGKGWENFPVYESATVAWDGNVGVKDKNGTELLLGDKVRYLNEGPHTKHEYWNPEYEIIWVAPSFTLKHVGGGKDGGSHDFILRYGGGNGNLELIERTPVSQDGQPITMTYRNYRSEVAKRTVTPKRIWWGSTDWHPEPGWLMTAYDPDKSADRDFALADCQFADLSPVATPSHPSPQPSDEALRLLNEIQEQSRDIETRMVGDITTLRAELKEIKKNLLIWRDRAVAEEARAESAEAALAAAEDHADVLAEALRPFSRYVDRETCGITVIWSDGDYRTTYSGTLKPSDFYAGRTALAAHRARRVGK